MRARANKASTAATLTRRTSKAQLPKLPERDHGWHRLTVDWWQRVWSSPMSDEWDLDSDLPNVLVCAMLYDDMMRAGSASARKDAASEFRLQRASLGLTPYDRRRLEWTIEQADDAKAKGRQRRASTAKKRAPRKKPVDPRAHLSVVS